MHEAIEFFNAIKQIDITIGQVIHIKIVNILLQDGSDALSEHQNTENVHGGLTAPPAPPAALIT